MLCFSSFLTKSHEDSFCEIYHQVVKKTSFANELETSLKLHTYKIHRWHLTLKMFRTSISRFEWSTEHTYAHPYKICGCNRKISMFTEYDRSSSPFINAPDVPQGENFRLWPRIKIGEGQTVPDFLLWPWSIVLCFSISCCHCQTIFYNWMTWFLMWSKSCTSRLLRIGVKKDALFFITQRFLGIRLSLVKRDQALAFIRSKDLLPIALILKNHQDSLHQIYIPTIVFSAFAGKRRPYRVSWLIAYKADR